MTCRAAVLAVLLSSSSAFADDAIVVAPACVTVDASDTLSPEDRERALRDLTRALERRDVLVVDHDCTEQYVLVHDADGIQLTGPNRARRAADEGDRAATYARLVEDVMRPEPVPAPVPVATSVPTAVYPVADSEEVDKESPPAPHSFLYAQLLVGSEGSGIGFGYRRPFDARLEFDLHASNAEGNSGATSAFGAAVFRNTNPHASTTTYVGGGMSIANHVLAMEESTGPRVDAVAGYAYGRHNAWSGFVQAAIAVPLYGDTPSLMLSVGGGR